MRRDQDDAESGNFTMIPYHVSTATQRQWQRQRNSNMSSTHYNARYVMYGRRTMTGVSHCSEVPRLHKGSVHVCCRVLSCRDYSYKSPRPSLISSLTHSLTHSTQSLTHSRCCLFLRKPSVGIPRAVPPVSASTSPFLLPPYGEGRGRGRGLISHYHGYHHAHHPTSCVDNATSLRLRASPSVTPIDASPRLSFYSFFIYSFIYFMPKILLSLFRSSPLPSIALASLPPTHPISPLSPSTITFPHLALEFSALRSPPFFASLFPLFRRLSVLDASRNHDRALERCLIFFTPSSSLFSLLRSWAFLI